MKNILDKIRKFTGHSIVQYYSRHPFVLARNRAMVYFLYLKKYFGSDPNFIPNIKSDIPLDLVVVVAPKDYDVLPHMIDSARKNIKHPIDTVVIISPKNEAIIKLAKEKDCRFIDENTVLPITRKDIDYKVNGEDRSGWVLQQLLKWSGDKYTKNKHIFIADSDTIFAHPQVFIYDKKTIFSVCHQLCHIPYFTACKYLFGFEVKPYLNLTSHHVLFERKRLSEIKKAIEKQTGKSWWEAMIATKDIDPEEGACVSDYDSYAQYIYRQYNGECRLEHWNNISISRKRLSEIDSLVEKYGRKYKTISFHSYKD